MLGKTVEKFVHFLPEILFGGDRGKDGWEEESTAASEEIAREICFSIA